MSYIRGNAIIYNIVEARYQLQWILQLLDIVILMGAYINIVTFDHRVGLVCHIRLNIIYIQVFLIRSTKIRFLR